MLHIAEEINEGSLSIVAEAAPGTDAPRCLFRISGGAPGANVSWRVEAVRNDRWMRVHGALVEADKEAGEQGTYLHPDLYDQPLEREMDHAATPARPAAEVFGRARQHVEAETARTRDESVSVSPPPASTPSRVQDAPSLRKTFNVWNRRW